MVKNRPLVVILAVLLIVSAGLAVWLGAGSGGPAGPGSGGGAAQDKDVDRGSNGPAMEAAKHNLYTLELERPLSSAERAALLERVDWAGEYDGHSLPIRAGFEQAGALESLPFIKSVGAYGPERKVTGELKAANSPGAVDTPSRVEIVVTMVVAEDKPEAVELIKRLGGRVTGGAADRDRYLKAEVPAGAVDKLAASALVLHLEKYHQPELLNDRARDITGAHPLAIPDFFTTTGLTGRGVMVGLADSGLDTGELGTLHPDLRNETGKPPRVVMIKSWAGVDKPADTIGHGTHMAGTIVGSGAASGGKYAGMAPGATLYFQGIMDGDNNLAPPLDLARLYLPAYEAGVRVHVNGWGRKNNLYISSPAQVDEFVRRYPDFLPVFGAGNFGPEPGSLTAEANSKNALVVGASRSPRPVFDNDTGSTLQAAEFSSRGPAADGRIKPELLAPGTSIISTSSSLVEGNLPGRPEYTRMQGTSMAAAVVGGSAALLQEYLVQQAGHNEPSSALMKAALINGARSLKGEPREVGFGLLDIGSTVLALERGTFKFDDEKKGVRNGETFIREFTVHSADAPLKVTLAWTDPPAAPGAGQTLVNNLDLVVVGPLGKRYLGNDTGGRGLPDTLNNVEQVVIEDPAPGVYRLEVRGTSVNTSVSSTYNSPRQDFALVYGQPPVKEVVVRAEQDSILLASGRSMKKPEQLTVALDDAVVPGDPLPGSDLYLSAAPGGPARALAAGRSWRASGIKVLASGQDTLLVRINRDYREGGFYIENHPENTVALNGIKLPGGVNIPPGSEITAAVNPSTQKLWQVQATSLEAGGVLSELDWSLKKVRLLGEEEAYRIAPEASFIFNDQVVEGDPGDLAFGAPLSAGLGNIVPGMPVRLMLGQDGVIYHAAVQRHVVVGSIAAVDLSGSTVTLSSGKRYSLLPGISMQKDGRQVQPSELGPGDLVMGILVPGSNRVLDLDAFSHSIYGLVIFAGKDTLYLADHRQATHSLKLGPSTRVYRWGLASDASLLAPGQWVRLVLNAGTGEIERVDIAEVDFQGKEILESCDVKNGLLRTASGEEYVVTDKTTVTKDGYPVRLRDLLPGEEVELVALRGAGGVQVLASAAAQSRGDSGELNLAVQAAIPFEEFYLLRGQTTATRLYAYYAGGKTEQVQLTPGGEFYYPVYFPHGGGVQLVGVDAKTGAVTGMRVKLTDRRGTGFSDIDGHWAETDIRNLASRGLLAGYGDNTFRPGQFISRVEFTAMVTRLLGGQSGTVPELPYSDAAEIPGWARYSVRMAAGCGLVAGYQDNTFRPRAPVSRAEAAAVLVRAGRILNVLPEAENPAPVYADAGKIPAWARQSVALAGQAGLMRGRPGNRFEPNDNITRAETAAVMNRLLELATRQNQDFLE